MMQFNGFSLIKIIVENCKLFVSCGKLHILILYFIFTQFYVFFIGNLISK